MALAPIPASLLSMATTTTVLIAIPRSKNKLKSSYRRILFGFSLYGVIEALTYLLSTLLEPLGGTEVSPWSFGDKTTWCQIHGFLKQLTTIAIPMYALLFATYYLYTVKYERRDEWFEKKLEPVVHIVTNVCVWFTASFILLSGSINPSKNQSCWIAPYPEDCLKNQLADCTRGKHAHILQWTVVRGPLILLSISCVIIMTKVCIYITDRYKRIGSYYDNIWQSNQQQQVPSLPGRRISSMLSSIFSETADLTRQIQERNEFENDANYDDSAIVNYKKRKAKKRNKKCREVIEQAILFTIIYVVNNGSNLFHSFFGKDSQVLPFWLSFTSNVIAPLQGFLYIYVLTRPHVVHLRRKHTEYSWVFSFWKILKSGGDKDSSLNRRRRSSATLVGARQRRFSTVSRSNSCVDRPCTPPKNNNILHYSTRTLHAPPLDNNDNFPVVLDDIKDNEDDFEDNDFDNCSEEEKQEEAHEVTRSTTVFDLTNFYAEGDDDSNYESSA